MRAAGDWRQWQRQRWHAPPAHQTLCAALGTVYQPGCPAHLVSGAVLAGVGHQRHQAGAVGVGGAAALQWAEGECAVRCTGEQAAGAWGRDAPVCFHAPPWLGSTAAQPPLLASKPGRGSQRSSRQAPQPSSGWRVALVARKEAGLTATAAQ